MANSLPPAPALVVTRSPIANKDGTATWDFIKILQAWNLQINNSLNALGQFIGIISPNAIVGGRTEGIGATLQHISSAGIVTPPGLPSPTLSTVGGIQAAAPVAHQWVNQIDTSGVPHLSQPAYSDISGTPTLAQNTPGVAHEWLNAYNSTTGVFGQSQPAFTDISGQITAAQLPPGGVTHTVPLAKLTVGGTNGSLTFVDGQLTASVDPT